MHYIVAGYVVVLGTLFLYAVSLVWRRRRLTRAALRAESLPPDHVGPATPGARVEDQ